MIDRPPTEMAMFQPNGAAPPARPPTSAIEASGTARVAGLRALWTTLGEASRRTLGMLAAAMAVIVAATIAAGLYTTERSADLAYAFMTEQTQNMLDMAVADLVWNDDRRAVTGLAGEIAAEVRQPFAAGDRAARSTILAEAGQRGAVWASAIGLLGAQVLGLALAVVALGRVAQSLRRAAAARAAAEAASEAERIVGRGRLADELECHFRGFAETMAATAARFEGHSRGVAETARTASDGSRDALGDGARVAERITAVAAAAEELTVSIREVGRQAAEARAVVGDAEARAQAPLLMRSSPRARLFCPSS